jgi:hypothetical protein
MYSIHANSQIQGLQRHQIQKGALFASYWGVSKRRDQNPRRISEASLQIPFYGKFLPMKSTIGPISSLIYNIGTKKQGHLKSLSSKQTFSVYQNRHTKSTE